MFPNNPPAASSSAVFSDDSMADSYHEQDRNGLDGFFASLDGADVKDFTQNMMPSQNYFAERELSQPPVNPFANVNQNNPFGDASNN